MTAAASGFLALPRARLLLVLVLLVAPAGCDSRAGAVKQAMSQIIEANDAHDGEKVASMYSTSTIEYYERLLRTAATAKKSEVMKLSLYDRGELIGMRRRLALFDMKSMDGRSYIKRSVRDGNWLVEWGVEDYGAVKVNGSTAWMSVKKPDTRTRTTGRWRQRDTRKTYSVRFYLENQEWKLDETSLHELWEEMMREDLKASGVSEEEFLLGSDDDGNPLPSTLLDPPKK